MWPSLSSALWRQNPNLIYSAREISTAEITKTRHHKLNCQIVRRGYRRWLAAIGWESRASVRQDRFNAPLLRAGRVDRFVSLVQHLSRKPCLCCRFVCSHSLLLHLHQCLIIIAYLLTTYQGCSGQFYGLVHVPREPWVQLPLVPVWVSGGNWRQEGHPAKIAPLSQ